MRSTWPPPTGSTDAGLRPDAAVCRLLENAGLAVLDHARVLWRVRQRHDTMLVDGGHGRTWCVKRRGAPLVTGEPTLSRELWFHQLVRRGEFHPRLTRHVPQLVAADQAADVLVFEAIPDALGLRDFFQTSPGADIGRVAADVGEALAALHGTPPAGSEPVVNPVQTYGRVTPEQLAHGPRATPELVRLLQAAPALDEALRALRTSWRPQALVHGDVKADNVLVQLTGDRPTTFLVDWELAGTGDPAWDCGGMLGSLFLLWLESLQPGIVEGEARESARRILEAARRFVVAYRQNRLTAPTPFDPAVEEELGLRWAGYWLLQRVTVMLPMRRTLSALDLSALHLASQLVGEGSRSPVGVVAR